MNRHYDLVTLLVILSCLSAVAADGGTVYLQSNVNSGAISAPFVQGALIPITLSIAGDGEGAIFGARLDIKVRGEGVRIHSVDFEPSFPVVTNEHSHQLPGRRCRITASQDTEQTDDELGLTGEWLSFATVRLEVLQTEGFAAGLSINACGALVGTQAAQTTLDGVTDAHGGTQVNYTVLNTNPPATPPSEPDWSQFIESASSARIFLALPGSNVPVQTLVANTAYDVHYSTSTDGVSGYTLFGVVEYVEEGIASATQPAMGHWAESTAFQGVSLVSETEPLIPAYGFTHYLVRQFRISDEREIGGAGTTAPPQGNLCTITTGEPGELTLDLHMYYVDEVSEQVKVMAADASYDVYNN